MIATVTLNTSVDRRYNIKEIKKNTVQRTTDYQATAGGKGINVSRVINLLDQELVAMGFIGGFSGDFILNELEKLNIKSDFTRVKAATRTCLNLIDQNNDSIEILENGPQITEAEKIRFLDNFEAKIGEFEVITISGSLPAGLENDFYQKIIKIAKKKNKAVILDTSGKALIGGIEAGPDIIKPNKSEIEAVIGFSIDHEIDFLKAGKKLQSMGAKNIALTLGKNGMYYLAEDISYKVEIPKVDAVNATGSGDSVTAGLAVAIKQEMNIEEMLIYANACGVANVVEKKTGCINKKNIEKYSKKIKVTKV
jgi:tagatose 6-phosphate kinase